MDKRIDNRMDRPMDRARAKPPASILRVCRSLLLCAGMVASASVFAKADLESQVQHVSEQLRCLVCQNQSIADSHAKLAQDLRREARQQLSTGRTEREVIDFMVQRYGDFVLYQPPFDPRTWLLWLGPFALLLAGLSALVVQSRKLEQSLEMENMAIAEES